MWERGECRSNVGHDICYQPPTDDPCSGGGITVYNGGDVDGTGHYYNNVDCEWTLECWSGTPVLEFQSFDTEGNFDYVYITDDSGARLYTFDGTSDSHSYSSHGPPLLGSTYNASRGSSALTVQFTSDGSVTRSDGPFRATYHCDGADGPAPPPPENTGPDERYCPSYTPFICLDVRTKDDWELSWDESMAVERCTETCKNEPVCWTPGEGLSWAQNMGGDGQGYDVNECAAYKLRPGSTYQMKCENSSKTLYNGQPKCFWDTLSDFADCNVNPYECSANRGDCFEEVDYCGNCKGWCEQCIRDFGVASCTPLQECLDACTASPDCNRNRVVCNECKDECNPPVRAQRT